jgi:C-terminal processing protease CtpA/Prc
MRHWCAVLVGAPTSGTIDFDPVQIDLVPPPPLLPLVAQINREGCSDDVHGPVDGVGVEPDISVEYDPADLARGRDTVLEAAASAVLKRP